MIYWFALVCTFSDTEAATEVTVDGLRQSFNFYNVYAQIAIGASVSVPQVLMMSPALVCVRACLCMCVHVGKACLGMSEVSVAGNEYGLGSDGWLRTSVKGQEYLAQHVHGSGEAIITKKRFVPEKFLPCS